MKTNHGILFGNWIVLIGKRRDYRSEPRALWWSSVHPSTSTIRVWIQLKSTVYILLCCVKRTKISKEEAGNGFFKWADLLDFILGDWSFLFFHHERHEFREIDATASILVRVVDHVLDLVLRRILASNSNFQNEMMFYIFGFDVGPNIRDSSSLNPRNIESIQILKYFVCF